MVPTQIRSDRGEAHRASIDAEARVVVVRQELASYLAYAINGVGLHHGILRGLIAGEVATESTDRAGGKYRTVLLASDLQRVLQSAHIDTHSQLGVLLTSCREECYKVEDRVNLVLVDKLGISLSIKSIESLERTRLSQYCIVLNIGCQDIICTVD